MARLDRLVGPQSRLGGGWRTAVRVGWPEVIGLESGSVSELWPWWACGGTVEPRSREDGSWRIVIQVGLV
jgi:hypothetical protein